MATVTTEAGFRSALTARDPEIILANDITLATYANISYTVTIKGQTPDRSLFWGNPTATSPNMLVVTSAGVLTIETIILDAQNRNGTLVFVNGGTLIMNNDTIIRNVRSTTSQNGVKVGSFSTPLVSGRFIMNGGLVTGIDSSDAVFCTSGSFIMNNNATISGNSACGVAIATPTGGTIRGSFTMTGNSRVTDNRSKQAGGGVINLRADMYMGINDGDAPMVSANRPPSGSYAGGILMTDNSTLTMRHDAKIVGNYSNVAGGGLMAQDAAITMRDNSSITDNVCEGSYGGGGARIHQGSQLILEDNAHISGNTSVAHGGGIYLQPGGHLEMKGNSYVDSNESVNGAGVYLAPPGTTVLPTSALIGADGSSPSIHNNTASGFGGGIFIGRQGRLDLTGNSIVRDNKAASGAGIYKMGGLNVWQSPKVTDGLFFEDITDTAGLSSRTAAHTDIRIVAEPAEDGSHIVLKTGVWEPTAADAGTMTKARMALTAEDPKYTDNVPVITDLLTQMSEIHVEVSNHVLPANVPLVLADKGTGYEYLGETDRAAWSIPDDFGQGYAVILNTELNQVLIAYEVYSIKYCHLQGAVNPNPDSYSIESVFPITLQNPGARPGYEFVGWYDCEGRPVTEIPGGTTGDMQLIALWKEHAVYNIKYCRLYGSANPNPISYGADTAFPIVLQKPGERQGYEFEGWHDCEGRPVTEIPGGTTGDILLIAYWKDNAVYAINYCHLYGVLNPNPATYNADSDLPVVLQKPGERLGYVFMGWHDCEGRPVTEIPKGSTGDIQLVALWKEYKVFSIKYCHLYGTSNPNPYFYSIDSVFPITLQKPGERPGYVFMGWYDCAGQPINEIVKGMMGDLLLIALWQKETKKIYLHFEGNARCVSGVPEPILAEPCEVVTIPTVMPKRQCHSFVSWNTCPDGTGRTYCPTDRITIPSTGATLYALWKPFYSDDDEYYPKRPDIKRCVYGAGC